MHQQARWQSGRAPASALAAILLSAGASGAVMLHRYNASVPQLAKLNYKQQPSSAVSADPVHGGATRKGPPLRSDRMVKKVCSVPGIAVPPRACDRHCSPRIRETKHACSPIVACSVGNSAGSLICWFYTSVSAVGIEECVASEGMQRNFIFPLYVNTCS